VASLDVSTAAAAFDANHGVRRWAELDAVERVLEAECILRENVRLRRLLRLMCAQGAERSAALVEVHFDPTPPTMGPSVRTFLVCSPGDEVALVERLTAELVRHVTPEGHPAPIARAAPPTHTGAMPSHDRPTVRVPPLQWRILSLAMEGETYDASMYDPLPAPSAEAAARRFVAEIGEVGVGQKATVTLIAVGDDAAEIQAIIVTPAITYHAEPAR
jgi:hypothetical protein